MSVVRAERETYEAAWSLPTYADFSPGLEALPFFLEMASASPGQTVLDAGCGSGRGGLALADAGFAVTMCDLTPAGLLPEARAPRGPRFVQTPLWEDLLPVAYLAFGAKGGDWRFDWTYCCDVLEHVPTQFTMLVVQRLLAVSRRGLFMSVSFVPDHFGLQVGKPLHQTVMPFTWWRDSLRELGQVTECRDRIADGFFLVRP